MIPLSFSIPIVHTEPAPVAQWPCCRSGLIRHERMLRGLTDLRLGAVTEPAPSPTAPRGSPAADETTEEERDACYDAGGRCGAALVTPAVG